MLNKLKQICGVLALWLAAAFPSWAIIPENGVWWAPSLDGSGFNLEVQDNVLVFASYGYDEVGNPAWFIAAGAMTSDRNFTAQLQRYSAGACLNCSYRKPVGTVIGNLTITFTSSQTANFSLLGVTIPVERFDFIGRMKSKPDTLLGEWAFVTGDAAFPVFFSDRVQMRTKVQGGLSGNRLGSSSRVAFSQVNSDGSLGMLVDASASYYDLYIFNTTGFNRVEGSNWTYLKTSNPTGSGVFFQGFRSASYAFVSTGRGPASSKAEPLSGHGDETVIAARVAAYKTAGLESVAAPAHVLSMAQELQAKLESAKVSQAE